MPSSVDFRSSSSSAWRKHGELAARAERSKVAARLSLPSASLPLKRTHTTCTPFHLAHRACSYHFPPCTPPNQSFPALRSTPFNPKTSRPSQASPNQALLPMRTKRLRVPVSLTQRRQNER